MTARADSPVMVRVHAASHWSASVEGVRAKLDEVLASTRARQGAAFANLAQAALPAPQPETEDEALLALAVEVTRGYRPRPGRHDLLSPPGLLKLLADAGADDRPLATDEEARNATGAVRFVATCPRGFTVPVGFGCPTLDPDCGGCPAKEA